MQNSIFDAYAYTILQNRYFTPLGFIINLYGMPRPLFFSKEEYYLILQTQTSIFVSSLDT